MLYNPDFVSRRKSGNIFGKTFNTEYMGENVFSDTNIKRAPWTACIPNWDISMVPVKHKPAVTAINWIKKYVICFVDFMY